MSRTAASVGAAVELEPLQQVQAAVRPWSKLQQLKAHQNHLSKGSSNKQISSRSIADRRNGEPRVPRAIESAYDSIDLIHAMADAPRDLVPALRRYGSAREPIPRVLRQLGASRAVGRGATLSSIAGTGKDTGIGTGLGVAVGVGMGTIKERSSRAGSSTSSKGSSSQPTPISPRLTASEISHKSSESPRPGPRPGGLLPSNVSRFGFESFVSAVGETTDSIYLNAGYEPVTGPIPRNQVSASLALPVQVPASTSEASSRITTDRRCNTAESV